MIIVTIIMLQTSTNITSKYRQETHYNYMENSDFFASNCSPLLCYRSVTSTNSYGNAIANSQGLLQAETELRLKKNTEGYREYKNPLHSSIISIPFYSFRKSLAKHFLEVAIYLLRGNNLV